MFKIKKFDAYLNEMQAPLQAPSKGSVNSEPKSEVVHEIGEIDEFLMNHPNKEVVEKWEEISDEFLSVEGTSFWADLDESDLRSAIDAGYDLMKRFGIADDFELKEMEIFEDEEDEDSLKEADLERDDISEKMDEFYEIFKEMKELESKLKKMKASFKKEFEDELDPIMMSMKEVNDRMLKADKYIVRIKSFGGTKETASYKDAFELALTKMNAATQRVMEEALKESKRISKFKHQIDIEKIDEGLSISKIKEKLSSIARKFKDFVRRGLYDINSSLGELERVAKVAGQGE